LTNVNMPQCRIIENALTATFGDKSDIRLAMTAGRFDPPHRDGADGRSVRSVAQLATRG
jgi:hypothetical protein